MDAIALILLVASIILSGGRNILSKAISDIPPGVGAFYLLQGTIFLSGLVPLLVSGDIFNGLSTITVILAAVYGIMLITAQWNYTAALKTGNTGVCATVYSLGFIFPTLSGMVFWDERFSLLRMFGIILVIPAIVLSGKKEDSGSKGSGYILPLVIAMLSSGGLGIMQKIQQSTSAKQEKTLFIFLAFVFAGVISLFRAAIGKKGEVRLTKKHFVFAAAVGLCFSICNLLNTVLAGMLDTAVFFPFLNVGSILFSLILSVIIFRERPDKKSAVVLILGIAAILLINMG